MGKQAGFKVGDVVRVKLECGWFGGAQGKVLEAKDERQRPGLLNYTVAFGGGLGQSYFAAKELMHEAAFLKLMRHVKLGLVKPANGELVDTDAIQAQLVQGRIAEARERLKGGADDEMEQALQRERVRASLWID